MKSALITGGAGFIGSHLAEYLIEKKYNVTVIDNLSKGKLSNLSKIKNKITFIKYDITKKNKNNIVFKNDYEYIFHLAALTSVEESFKKPKKYILTNLKATKLFFKKINLNKTKKIIYAASASCYGKTKKNSILETHKIMPISPYAKSKYKGEKFLKHYSKKKKIEFISLRLFNVYGPRSGNNSYSGVINNFITNFLNKKFLNIYSDGEQTRSFVYISDVVRAFALSAKSKIKNEAFNVGYPKSTSINLLASFFKIKKKYYKRKKGDIKFSTSNINKIYKSINWKPMITLKTGLKQTLKYQKKYS